VLNFYFDPDGGFPRSQLIPAVVLGFPIGLDLHSHILALAGFLRLLLLEEEEVGLE